MTENSSNPAMNDRLRQIVNLVGAPLMWVLSTLSFFDPNARSPEGLSEINESQLVPLGFAFSIWFPIFVGCIAYGVIQALGTNKTRDIFRQLGPWTAAGFILICVWSLISAYAPQNLAQFGTALIFIPAMLCLVKAMLILSRRSEDLDKLEKICVYVPISLIAGWTSLAVFLNWTPIAMNLMGTSVPDLIPNVIMLGLALIWASIIVRKSGGNRAYAFPIIWGLSFLALKQLGIEKDYPIIGGLALIGALWILGLTVYKPKTPIR